MNDAIPVVGVCGYCGSGKTTLLERILPRLIEQGLRVAVLKHDVHGLARDPAGKDSDRLHRAGADVWVQGPGECLANLRHAISRSQPGRTETPEDGLEETLDRLADRYDLVLLEGFKRRAGPKVWLLHARETAPPQALGPWEAVLPWDSDRSAAMEEVVARRLREAARHTPLFGCVLIGGGSTRMGQPKHLLPTGRPGETWLHRTVRYLADCCQRVVVCGGGDVPADLGQLPQLPDPPGLAGPTAGLLSAMRWAPRTSWLAVACDLPAMVPAALEWLLGQRRPGVWAVLPRAADDAPVEPLLAWYDFRCRAAVEGLALTDPPALRRLAEHPKVRVATVPSALSASWADADTPQDAFGSQVG